MNGVSRLRIQCDELNLWIAMFATIETLQEQADKALGQLNYARLVGSKWTKVADKQYCDYINPMTARIVTVFIMPNPRPQWLEDFDKCEEVTA